jgi:hypothetical protein
MAVLIEHNLVRGPRSSLAETVTSATPERPAIAFPNIQGSSRCCTGTGIPRRTADSRYENDCPRDGDTVP